MRHGEARHVLALPLAPRQRKVHTMGAHLRAALLSQLPILICLQRVAVVSPKTLSRRIPQLTGVRPSLPPEGEARLPSLMENRKRLGVARGSSGIRLGSEGPGWSGGSRVVWLA